MAAVLLSGVVGIAAGVLVQRRIAGRGQEDEGERPDAAVWMVTRQMLASKIGPRPADA